VLGVIVVARAQHEQTTKSLGTRRGKCRRLESGIQPELGLSKGLWKTYKWKAMQGKAKYADTSFLGGVCIRQSQNSRDFGLCFKTGCSELRVSKAIRAGCQKSVKWRVSVITRGAGSSAVLLKILPPLKIQHLCGTVVWQLT